MIRDAQNVRAEQALGGVSAFDGWALTPTNKFGARRAYRSDYLAEAGRRLTKPASAQVIVGSVEMER
jgi:hypothetical protein